MSLPIGVSVFHVDLCVETAYGIIMHAFSVPCMHMFIFAPLTPSDTPYIFVQILVPFGLSSFRTM